ncbi:hypothetical protein BLNAU_2337 [Blattamonas nauphoetae]|uniref:Uncharacterized protein n=1 Tax=Blattamonas nauphoetae TaxID=2049346 RepID=A0ABQ9YFL2_9EUKA|nr:hypothetical protein BLNAU_2337 [Blattamonas nauphoetae]
MKNAHSHLLSQLSPFSSFFKYPPHKTFTQKLNHPFTHQHPLHPFVAQPSELPTTLFPVHKQPDFVVLFHLHRRLQPPHPTLLHSSRSCLFPSSNSPMRLVSDSTTGSHSYSIETPFSRSIARGGLDTPLRLGSPSISEDLPLQFASPVKVKSVSDLHDFSVALYCQEWDSVDNYGLTYLASRHDVTVPFQIQFHEKSVFPEDCNPELCTPTENDSGSDSQISDPAFVSSFFFPLLLTNRVDLLCLAYNTASDQKLQRIVRSSLCTISHEPVEEREFSILIRILTIIQDPTHPRLKCMHRNFLSNHSEKSSRSSRQKRAAPNTTKEPHQPVLPQPETSKLVKGGGHAAVGQSPRRHRSGTESQLVLPVQHINQLSEFIEINYQQFFLHPASIINLTRALLNMLLMDSIKNNRPVSKAEAEDDDVSTLLIILTQPDRSAQNTSTAQNALVTENGVTPKTVFRGLIAVIQRLLSASFLLTQAHSTILVASLKSLIHSLFVVSKYPQAQWSALRLLAHHRSFIPPPSRAIHTIKAQLQASPGVQKQTTSLPTSIILPASFHPSFLDTHLIHQHQLLNIQSSEHSPSANFTPFRPISNHNTQMFSLTPLSHPGTMESIPLVASLDTLSIDPPSFNPTEDAFLFSFLRAMTEMVIHNARQPNWQADATPPRNTRLQCIQASSSAQHNPTEEEQGRSEVRIRKGLLPPKEDCSILRTLRPEPRNPFHVLPLPRLQLSLPAYHTTELRHIQPLPSLSHLQHPVVLRSLCHPPFSLPNPDC